MNCIFYDIRASKGNRFGIVNCIYVEPHCSQNHAKIVHMHDFSCIGGWDVEQVVNLLLKCSSFHAAALLIPRGLSTWVFHSYVILSSVAT